MPPVYKNDENIRLYAEMLLALAFVQPSDVTSAFEELSGSCPDPLDKLYDY